jgi:hypothetical protein
MEPEFPAYRRLRAGHHYYRIEGPTAFTDLQVIGRRHMVHRVNGAAYPERVRIHEMLACKGPYLEMEAGEWERMYARIR